MSTNTRQGNRGALAGMVCLLSGLAAVGHELLWTRRLLDLLGGSADSASVVFGVFVLGLALGAGLAAGALRRAGGAAGALASAAACQVWFVLASLPILCSVGLSEWLWPRLGTELLAQPGGFALRLALAAGLLLPPSLVSGAFLPLLLAALCGPSRPHDRLGPLLYGVNTLGGMAAVLAVPLILERHLGLHGCGVALSALNLLLAAAVLALGAAGAGGERPGETLRRLLRLPLDLARALRRDDGPETGTPLPSFPRHLLPVLAVGALVLALEMVAYHQASQVAASSLHVTVLVLGSVLLGLGLGSFAARFLGRFRLGLPLALAATALLALVQPALFCALTDGLRPFALHAGPGPYARQAIVLALLAFVPLFTAAGTLFPLLFARASADLADPMGLHWGRLLRANGFGCLAGALAGQYALMPLAGLWRSMGLASAACGAVLVVLLARGRHWVWLGAVFLTALVAVPRAGRYGSLPLFHPPAPGLAARQVRQGRDGVAVLLENAAGQRRILSNNSYGIGGSHSARLDRMQMLLPLVLHPAPRRVAAIGMGAGFTAEAALLDPAVATLDSVEISPAILALARDGFNRDRRGLFTDPRSRVHLADGRLFLAARRDAYDVIVGDLFVPWREGLGGLYSLEFCRSARAALADGGIYCQWVPLYQVREVEFQLIARTFLAVFPDAWLVRNSFALRNPSVGLVGRKGGPLPEAAAIQARTTAFRAVPDLGNAFLHSPGGVALHLLGPLPDYLPERGGSINTLGNARLGYLASAGVLRRDWQALTLEPWRQTLAAIFAGTGPDAGPLWPEGAQAAQHWLDGQAAMLEGNRAAAQAAVVAGLRAMPAEVLADPRFAWEDFLVDVGLPIPRNYREVAVPLTGGGGRATEPPDPRAGGK
ncbi:MAG: hypothetical protein RBU25_04430 [Lentisphaeria bacterium]|jgi:spermidine synthase|nr:hypothetical protein [Lentisphaeria bacterium]